MFHLVLSVTVKDMEQHNRVYHEMGGLQDQLAGEVPSVNLSSYDMTRTLPDTEELVIDENTMIKVIECFYKAGYSYTDARMVIDQLQNDGILFRERRLVDATDVEEDEAREGEESADSPE